jgi:hypothetical protein
MDRVKQRPTLHETAVGAQACVAMSHATRSEHVAQRKVALPIGVPGGWRVARRHLLGERTEHIALPW